MIWLGEKRGDLSDWTTQQWVRATGRYISLTDHSWLDGPAGGTRQIGKHFFEKYADEQGLKTVRSGIRGLIADFRDLEEGNSDLSAVSPTVREFYEQTSEFELDAWPEWNGFFRPFGRGILLCRACGIGNDLGPIREEFKRRDSCLCR